MFVIDPAKVQNSDDLLSQIFLKSSVERVSAAVTIRQKKLAPITSLNKTEQKPSKIVQQFLESQNIEIGLPKIEPLSRLPSTNASPLKTNKRRSISQNSGDIQNQIAVKSPELLQKTSVYCYNNRQISQLSDYNKAIKSELKKRDLTFNDLLTKVSQKIAESELRNSPKNVYEQQDSPKYQSRRIFLQPLLKTRQKGFVSCPRNKKDTPPPINITQYYLNNHGNSSTMSSTNKNSVLSPKSLQMNNNEMVDKNLALKDNIVLFLKTSIEKNQVFQSSSIASSRSPRHTNRNPINLNKIKTSKQKNNNNDELPPSPSLDRWQFDKQKSYEDVSLGSQYNDSTMIEGENLVLPMKYIENTEEQIQKKPFYLQRQRKNMLPSLGQQVKPINQQSTPSSFTQLEQQSQMSSMKSNDQIFSTCCDHVHDINIDHSQKYLIPAKQQQSPIKTNPPQKSNLNFEFTSLGNEQIQTSPQRTSSVKSRAKLYFQTPKYFHQKENNLQQEQMPLILQPTMNQVQLDVSPTKKQQQIDFSFEPIGKARLIKKQEVNNSQVQVPSSPIKDTAKLAQTLRQTERQRQRSNSPTHKYQAKNVLLPPKEVTAQSWAAFDFEQKQFIDGKLSYIQREIASLTKIMTFYVAYKFFEDLKLDTKLILFQVTQPCTLIEGTSAKLEKGTWLSVWDLFHGLLLPSGNDCAELIAVKVGAMIELKQQDLLTPSMDMFSLNIELDKCVSTAKMNFIVKMNEYSKTLQMNSSFFSNVTGLTDSNNLSTAYDLGRYIINYKITIGLLCIECMQISDFRQIVRKQEHIADIYDNQSEKMDKIWFNTNKLLTNGFCGIKTGITGSAGPCLANFIKLKDSETGIKKQIITVLLDCYTVEDRWEDSYLLARWAIKAIQQNDNYNNND